MIYTASSSYPQQPLPSHFDIRRNVKDPVQFRLTAYTLYSELGDPQVFNKHF